MSRILDAPDLDVRRQKLKTRSKNPGRCASIRQAIKPPACACSASSQWQEGYPLTARLLASLPVDLRSVECLLHHAMPLFETRGQSRRESASPSIRTFS